MKALFALALGGFVLAGCAAANPSTDIPAKIASRAPDACFGSGDIINVNVIDKKTLYVATRRGYVYRLDAPGGCYIQGAPIFVEEFSGAGGTCIGNQAKVAVGASFRGPSYQCIATISGPYVDSRKTGLWARPLTP